MRINTRNPISLGMVVGGVALMLVAVIVDLAMKPPTLDQALAPGKKKIFAYKLEEHKNQELMASTLQDVQKSLWTDPDDQIAPKALNHVTALAQKHNLKVTTFRPQKEMPAGALITLPFYTSIEGPFPQVAAFIQDFEKNEQLLVLEMVQITASDESTHNVTVAINLDAYIDPNRPQPASKADKTAAKAPPAKASQKDAAHSSRTTTPSVGKA